ncbi:transcription factor Adf-1-like [Penaeus indicus]|uniref:transcription factor Adf-1-like n=1 Tax=Penaeus indicus TaxID=29960 RepID=UPI00300C0F4A
MDIDNLITEVSMTPCIWDASHKQHSDRTVTAQQWKRIAEKLGVSDEAAKKKFKNLRDQFRLELKKVPLEKSGDQELQMEEYLTIWPWFRKMYFLKDQILRRANTGNSSGASAKRKYEMDYTEGEIANQPSPLQVFDGIQNYLSKGQSEDSDCSKKMKESSLQGNFLEMLRKQAEEERDGDRMFLLSLLPAMKALEPQRACLFRIKVQQLLYEAQFSQDFGQTFSE